MKTIEISGGWVEMDEKATVEWYAGADEWGCECGHCRNFLALTKSGQLPPAVTDMLAELGIPPEKATCVCEIMPKDGGHLYQFSYRIAGSFVCSELAPRVARVKWGDGECCHEIYPYGAPGFPEPHFDLEFWETLPWVFEET